MRQTTATRRDSMGERILGMDPGLETTGFGLVTVTDGRPAHVRSGVVTTRAQEPLPERLVALHTQLAALLDATAPHTLVLESLYSHYQHPITAILMGHARGVICLAAAQRQIPVVCYLPTHVKKAVTGHGHATKAQVQGMVTAMLGLSHRPEPHDVSDALALALAHAQTLREPRLVAALRPSRRRTLPAALQEALR